MVNKRVKNQCSICERYFATSAKLPAGASAMLCKSCKDPSTVRSQMIVIEVKEHSHLLSLYHSLYLYNEFPSVENEVKLYQRLDDCNHFFSGGKKCL